MNMYLLIGSNRANTAGYLHVHRYLNIHIAKVREHLLCYEGKLWTIIFLQSKYVLTKLFSYSKYVVSKVASARKLRIAAADSGHLGYRSSISDFRTPLIFLAMNAFHEV